MIGPSWVALSIAMVALALAWQATLPTNWDVSWLIELAGRTLDGARPYLDFFEPNPPASIALYVPAVLAGRLSGLSPEVALRIFVFAGAGASGGVSGWLLARGGLVKAGHEGPVVAVLIFVLLILPAANFGQREHVALIASLPMLATIACRSAGSRPPFAAICGAGIAAGVAVSIKPVFFLAFVLPAVFCWRAAGWRALRRAMELWIAAATVAAYALCVLVFVPAYAQHALPLTLAVYLPGRSRIAALLLSQGFVIWVALFAVARLLSGSARSGLATILAGGSAGFEAAMLIQGKGWAYHAYPALALAALACAQGLVDQLSVVTGGLRPHRMETACLAVSLAAGTLFCARHYDARSDNPGLTEAVRSLAPHPRFVAISDDCAVGHPFVDQVGGTWVGSAGVAWVTASARAITDHPERVPGLAAAIRIEQDVYARDIGRSRPDAILVDGDQWLEWVAASPALSEIFSRYRREGVFGNVTLWVPRHAHEA